MHAGIVAGRERHAPFEPVGRQKAEIGAQVGFVDAIETRLLRGRDGYESLAPCMRVLRESPAGRRRGCRKADE
ncbi:hypothetical protein NUTIK01_26010 [Novosphingobium sp. IK01]|uniref:Uncharacterized protein n=1 Tax=Novosphingobium pituita TaxID=3056842 RepID=A0ABQ6P9B5_9SPHN|nr:hypothetical protein NUTIK01_26010 [Novosphingobium sp. IK01]